MDALQHLVGNIPVQAQIEELLRYNEVSARYGLALTPQQAQLVAQARQRALSATRRVEFAGGALPKLIYAFCDSPFIAPAAYADTLIELQEIFYYFKNETQDAASDDELIETMCVAFNGVCQGSTQLLAGKVLEEYANTLRGGTPDILPATEEEDVDA